MLLLPFHKHYIWINQFNSNTGKKNKKDYWRYTIIHEYFWRHSNLFDGCSTSWCMYYEEQENTFNHLPSLNNLSSSLHSNTPIWQKKYEGEAKKNAWLQHKPLFFMPSRMIKNSHLWHMFLQCDNNHEHMLSERHIAGEGTACIDYWRSMDKNYNPVLRSYWTLFRQNLLKIHPNFPTRVSIECWKLWTVSYL